MDNRVIEAFENTLEKMGIVALSTDAANPPALIPYGSYQLADNTDLCANLCNRVAEKTKAFWTLTEFKRLQNTSPEKPVEPDPEDPQFIPPKGKTYPPEIIAKMEAKYGDLALDRLRLIDAANNYNSARNTYETRYQSYERLLLQSRRIRAHYDFDDRGYVALIAETVSTDFPAFAQSFFFTPKTLWINERAREKHTFITGGTGSGKSETIKTIIRHYLTKNTEPAIVVLDPHGDLAEDVARFKENADNDRLVYIRPGAFNRRTVSFNPFEFPDKDEVSLNRGQKQFLGALQEIVGETLTKPQRALLTPCLGVLLHKDGTTLQDLVRFMDDGRNRDLVSYGAQSLPNEQDRDFFRNQFQSSNFESTKEALRYRFNEIIRDPTVRGFLCNDSTFDLPASLEAGKLIVFHFDPSKQEKDAITTVGQLINAYLVSYAMSRPKGRRRAIHLFADECQYFISPTISEIMGETRKFGLYATLATQRTDQVGPALADAIFGNVGCYLIGRNKNKTAEKMAKEHPISADDVRELRPLEFYQIELDRDPVRTRIEIVGDRHALKGEAWRDVLLKQGERFYRSELPAPEYQRAATPDELAEANQSRRHQGGRKLAFPITKLPPKKPKE